MTDIAIPLPEEIREGTPHGQWVFDRPGLVLNFLCDLRDGMPDVEAMARQMNVFLNSRDPYMAFESPHTPGINYLHRHAAEHIIATQVAWSKRVYLRTDPNGQTRLVDANSGVPIVRKTAN